jgi:hypothetical protein
MNTWWLMKRGSISAAKPSIKLTDESETMVNN